MDTLLFFFFFFISALTWCIYELTQHQEHGKMILEETTSKKLHCYAHILFDLSFFVNRNFF